MKTCLPKRALVVAWLLALSGMATARNGEIGDLKVYPEPPVPPLPGAGKTMVDATFGTTILQVTGEGDGESANHGYSQWTPFNCNSTRFFLAIRGVGFVLYDFDGEKMTCKKAGLLNPGPVRLQSARWDAENPDVLYALGAATDTRKLYRYDVAKKTLDVVHDFTREVPLGGYYDALDMSFDARYFGFWVNENPGGGQDTGHTTVVYDKKEDKAYVKTWPASVMSGVHALQIDKAGDYLVISAMNEDYDARPTMVVWDFRKDSYEGLYRGKNSMHPDKGGGHWDTGFGSYVNCDPGVGSQVVMRNLNDPHHSHPVLTFPKKNGVTDWNSEDHVGWENGDKRFFFISKALMLFDNTPQWERHAGNVYVSRGFTKQGSHPFPPDVARHNGVSLKRAEAIPTKAGEWYYDKAADALYAWGFDDADLADRTKNRIAAIDWRVGYDEAIQVWIDDPKDTAKMRRLCHTYSFGTFNSPDAYGEQPHAVVDRSGKYVMFQSSWGGRKRVDEFIAKVPEMAK